MTSVAITRGDFSQSEQAALRRTDHWCVCSWKKVIGGLFDTRQEAEAFALKAIAEGNEAVSIQHVGSVQAGVSA